MNRRALTSNPLFLSAMVVVGLVTLAAVAYAYFEGLWPFERKP